MTLLDLLNRPPFGTYMREQRLRANLTLRTAAEKIGVSNPYISLIETGQRNPPKPSDLLAFAQVYGVPAWEMLERAGYLWLPNARAKRLMDADREQIQKLLKPQADKMPRSVRAALFLWNQDEFIEMINHAQALYERIKGEGAEGLERVLRDPQLVFPKHYPKRRPRLKWYVEGLISELYFHYQAERRLSEALQMHSGRAHRAAMARTTVTKESSLDDEENPR